MGQEQGLRQHDTGKGDGVPLNLGHLLAGGCEGVATVAPGATVLVVGAAHGLQEGETKTQVWSAVNTRLSSAKIQPSR